MTKLFEALEQAEENRPATQKPAVSITAKSFESIAGSLNMEVPLTTLLQNITTLLPDQQCRIIQFISSRPKEGTSTLLREFAKLCSTKLHRPVLILDCCQSQKGQMEKFNLNAEYGWIEAATNDIPVTETIRWVQKSRLAVAKIAVNRGSDPQGPGSSKFSSFLKELKNDFGLILIDSPSAAESSDNLVPSKTIDGMVLVIEAEKTRWQVAQTTQNRIESQGINILGILLNKRTYPIPKFIYKRM